MEIWILKLMTNSINDSIIIPCLKFLASIFQVLQTFVLGAIFFKTAAFICVNTQKRGLALELIKEINVQHMANF